MKKIFGYLFLGLLTLAASAQWSNPSSDVPAYNREVPKQPQPPIMSGNQLTGPYFEHSYQVVAYKMAAKIPNVLSPAALLLPLRPRDGSQQPA